MARIWPVIHYQSPAQVLRNVTLAAKAGVHGVFLIHMDGDDALLDPVGRDLIVAYPQLRIGVNYLSLSAPEALERSLRQGYAATWTDKPGVRSNGLDPSVQAIAATLTQHPHHRFFASVAFKYQPEDPNPGDAARRALEFGMTPTTSGVATGQAPDEDKLKLIRAVIGPRSEQAPLALASGVTPDNASVLAPHLTDILVSTGISPNFYDFDARLLANLMAVTKRPSA